MSPEKFDTKDLVVTTGEERTKNAHMVTVEHLPSGIGVRCYEHKSQAMNCRRALDLLWGLLVKPAPAAPVTDAEIETAVERCVDAGLQHGYLSSDLYDERERLLDLIARRLQQAESGQDYLEEKLASIERVLEQDMKGEHCRVDGEIVERAIARRVQQANAAAEDLARAVETLFASRVCSDEFEIERVRDLEDALAAFRKAQGGGK